MKKWIKQTIRIFSLKAHQEQRIEWLGHTCNIMGHVGTAFDGVLSGLIYYAVTLHGNGSLITPFFTLTLNLTAIQQLAISGIGWSFAGWAITGLSYWAGGYYYSKLAKRKKKIAS